ncbi:hypothetical protein [Virgibacillus halodenitrificans]|uniref:hypothetical protein n=1 Tax=Virgibacillus halodenitrificans TaxID=1482 RepID=UPI000EF544A6|nr:hypothetical protein [Virgibacillus halodenitrificans]
MTIEKQLSFFDELEGESLKKESKILTAADMFQPYFLSTYVPMKQTDKRMETIKTEMKGRLEDDSRKRIEFNKTDIVAKWRVVPKYETDYVGLNELLYDHGLFQLISMPTRGLSEELKEDLEAFKLPIEYYVVPNVNNKKAKEKLKEKEEFQIEQADSDSILLLFNRYYNINKEREEDYEQLKKKMARCSVLKNKKKLTFDYGSIGLREKNKGYDIDNIIEFFGIEYLLANGKPDMQAIEYFMDKNIIKRKEVAKFRTEIDRRLDFVLMTKESEEKQNEIYQKKLKRRIRLSMES